MSVKCGRGHYHDSIAEVRECYGVESAGLPRPEYRTNKYAGHCRLCGNRVEAEQGRVDKIDDKWEVSHLEGKCGPKTSKLKIEHTPQYADIAQGHYATKSLSGNNDYDFWRVDRPTEGQYAGKAFVKRIVGGKPEMSVSRTTKFAVLEQILSEGADVCAKRYADELGRCSRCNRTLTDETSRMYGQGPECRSK
jgi:hypothetical protein